LSVNVHWRRRPRIVYDVEVESKLNSWRLLMTSTIKEEARRMIDRLPDDATWEDLQYEIYFRQEVERGLKDSKEGRTISTEELRRELGMDPS
jgi:hypothetical protein